MKREHSVLVALVALAAAACSSASGDSGLTSPAGPACGPLEYIAGDRCQALAINDGGRDDATIDAAPSEAGSDSGDASFAEAGFADGEFAADFDAGFALSACNGATGDLFILGGDDYIHSGPPMTIEGTAFTVTYSNDPATGDVDRIDIWTNASGWNVTFSTRQLSAPLAVGAYADAEREPFANVGHPGLSVIGDGRGCNMVSGSFEVVSIATYRIAPDGSPDAASGDAEAPDDAGAPDAAPAAAMLRSFTATFREHCDSSTTYDLGCVHVEL
jgi:hypothetical protein